MEHILSVFSVLATKMLPVTFDQYFPHSSVLRLTIYLYMILIICFQFMRIQNTLMEMGS